MIREFERAFGVASHGLDLSRYHVEEKPKDHTVYLQNLLDKGKDIPPGVYDISDTLVINSAVAVRDCVFNMHTPEDVMWIKSSGVVVTSCIFNYVNPEVIKCLKVGRSAIRISADFS